MKKFITSQYQRIKSLYLRYERILMPATLVIGFLVDYFTFTNIQISITFTVLSIYWVIAGVTIAFTSLYDAGQLPGRLRYFRLFSPLAIQFTFGALLSASLIFYWFSGAFSISWPLMMVVAVLMVSNDIFRHYFIKPAVQISVYFFTTLSLLLIILPFIFNSLSIWIFIGAGGISSAIFALYLYGLFAIAPHSRRQKYQLIIPVAAILLAMNVLYFTDIIPPIPLALREAGLYHSIKTSGGTYTMRGEPEYFLQNVFGRQTLHIKPDDRVYLYTAIFAPAKIKTAIVHRWQYYDPVQKEWLTKDKLSFSITGGRQDGFKGYSWESELTPGRWRVYVENQRGQVLGRIRFNVEKAQGPIELQEVIR